MKLANSKARGAVQAQIAFNGANTSGRWEERSGGKVYIVESYGPHFPMFIFKEGVWYENGDKYSPTTSKHRTQLHPCGKTFILSTKQMQDLAYSGTF